MSTFTRALVASVLLLLTACRPPAPGTGENPPEEGGHPPVVGGPPPLRVPGAPGSPMATAGHNRATVTWSAPLDDGGAPIIGYRVYASPDGVTVSASAEARQVVVSSLRHGTAYTFMVAAFNAAGQGAASSPSSAVIPVSLPGAPTAVSATVGNAQSTVSWSAPLDTGGTSLTGYTVTTLPPGGPQVHVGANTTQAVVTGLTNGSLYSFTVAASNVVGMGPDAIPSASVTPVAPPGAPANVTVQGGNASADVSWQVPVLRGELPITGYTVTLQPGDRSVTLDANTFTTRFDALQPGAPVTFSVRAMSSVGTGEAANVSFHPFGFRATASLTIGGTVYSVASGDLDGNGTLDLVSVDFLYGLVTLWYGEGDGTFASGKNYYVGSNPTAAVVGDFNKDGRVDVAVANNRDNSVSILLRQADGTYRTGSIPYTSGSGPQGLATADFNADGNLDLAVPHRYYGTGLKLLPGRGDGSFNTAVDILTGGPDNYAVATADFDLDGKQDVVVTTTRPSLSVLRGNGDGTFGTEASYSTSSTAHAVVVADFNKDGAPDLAAPQQTSNSVTVRLNTGTGGFGSARTYAMELTRPQSITAGDFNHDGHTDLAVAYLVSSYVTLLFNRGDGTFYTAVHYSAKDAGFVNTQDVNGDGKGDFIISSYNSGIISVWLSL